MLLRRENCLASAAPRFVAFLETTRLNRPAAHILRFLPLAPSAHLLVRKCVERLP